MEVELRRGLLSQSQPAKIIVELPIGVNSRLDAKLAGAKLNCLADAPNELVLIEVVGLGRAAALAEAAEGAADGADVRDVDVAIDDEADLLANQLSAQLVGGDADLLDRFWPRLSKERRQLRRAQRLTGAPLLNRRANKISVDRERRLVAAGAAARDEAPILGADRVENGGGRPLRSDVLRVDAEPLGQRDAVLEQSRAGLMRRRERLLGRDVITVRREAAKVGGACRNQPRPVLGKVRWNLHADAGNVLARIND